MRVKISPSLMCVNLLRIEEDIRKLDAVADYYHVDIIDWHYCKNMSLAPCFMEAIKKVTKIPMEAHLYVDNIEEDLVNLCIDSGAEIITMPPEVIERQVYRLSSLIHKKNKKFGVFINPAVSLDIIKPYADKIDNLLIMSVDPGFAGQKFIRNTLDKIKQASQWKEQYGYTYEIAVDGCCNEKYYKDLYDAGCEVFIIGSSGLFNKNQDLNKAIDIMINNIKEATQ